MISAKLVFLMALGLVLVASALADDQHCGQCSNGQWPDGNGCCPREIDNQFYYRDGRGCYPIKRHCGVFYADGTGCYPDENGVYLKAGECCPEHRQCKPECDH